MSEMLGSKEETKAKIKELFNKIHNGNEPDSARDEFNEAIKGLSPLDIAKIEGEMIKEGMPREEIHDLFDVHLAPLKESIDGTAPMLPDWHPIRILLGEHREFLKGATMLRNHANAINVAAGSAFASGDDAKGTESVRELLTKIENIVGGFKHEDLHYQREENVLFAYLEKHGIIEPPAIMWADHDIIRGVKKTLRGLVENMDEMDFLDFTTALHETAMGYHEMISSHFYKENNILFPSSVKVISDTEWDEIRESFDDIGYFFVKPPEKRPPEDGMTEGVVPGYGMELAGAVSGSQEKSIRFDSGHFSVEELEAVLNSLPIDMTFVDAEDKVRYFSQGKERIFVRTKSILGREVGNCHPQKSVHVVKEIVEDFKSGKRDTAEFWINLEGTLVHIRYFAVRGNKGQYLGTVEVSQDITPIQRITGEKRLLDSN